MALYRCIQPPATQPADEMITDESSSSSSSSSPSSSDASIAAAPLPSQSASASPSRSRASSVEKYFFRDVGQVTCLLRPDADIRRCRHSALIELHVDQRAWAANDQLHTRLSLAMMPEAQFAMMFGTDVVPAPIIPVGAGSESASAAPAASASSSSEMDIFSAQSTAPAVQQPAVAIPQLQPVTHQHEQIAIVEDAPIATLDNVVSALMINTKLTAATAFGSDAVVGIGPAISILETLGIDKSASAGIPGELKIIYRRESTRAYTDAELQQLRANGQSISHLPQALSLKAFAHLARSHAHRINPILSRRTLTQMMEVCASLG